MEVTTLQVLDVIGTWVAAIGTVGAVITSLWLSFNSNKEKLKINASVRIMSDNKTLLRHLLCIINIVNIGIRQSKINAIGWEIGNGKDKKTFWQNTQDSLSDYVPKTLHEGEEANILINCNGEVEWLTEMAKNTKGYKEEDLKVVVVTAIDTFKVKVDNSLITELKKERKRLSELEE